MTLKAVIIDGDGTLADTEGTHRDAFNATCRHHGLPWEWDEALTRDLLAVTGGKERLRHCCERFFPRFLDDPFAEETIVFLHAQKTRRHARLAEIGAGEGAEAKKPAPDICLWEMEQLGLPPDNCLAIEDSRNGLLAAHAAGLPVILAESAWTAGDDFAEAVALLSDLGEPHRPYQVIRSALGGIGHVDAAALRLWHVAWRAAKHGPAT